MSEPAVVRPCYRFLHVCYCNADATAATEFFVQNFGFRNTMNTPMERSHGRLLGIDSDIECQARFVYDRRGPRVSPAVEVQHWVDPALEGTPSLDPFEVGVKALGIAVADLDTYVDRLVTAGCRVIARGPTPFEADTATLVDPTGVTLELTHDEVLGETDTQLHHLRVTVTDLEVSLPFYEALGFDVIDRSTVDSGAFVGVEGEVAGRYARLRLPDEPMEVRLIQWDAPAGHGRHYAQPFHAGLFRAALGVEDTRAAYAEMSAAGMVFDRPPQDVVLSGTPVPNMWITFISDPDGIPYEFVQRERSIFR